MHTEESAIVPHRRPVVVSVLIHNLLHTTADGAFGMKSRRVKLLQISCFSVCLNKTPKSLCAVPWLFKFGGEGGGLSKS